MFVLDASVILKWFIEEEGSKKAVLLKDAHARGKITITVPDLLILEASNVLRHNPAFSQSKTIECIKYLYDLKLDIVTPVLDITIATIQLAYKRNITFYDAIYIALAQELEFQYVTADKKLYKKVKDLPFTKLLKDIEI